MKVVTCLLKVKEVHHVLEHYCKRGKVESCPGAEEEHRRELHYGQEPEEVFIEPAGDGLVKQQEGPDEHGGQVQEVEEHEQEQEGIQEVRLPSVVPVQDVQVNPDPRERLIKHLQLDVPVPEVE